MDTGQNRTGIDHVAHIACPDRFKNLIRALRKLPSDTGTNTVLPKEVSSSDSRLYIEAQVVESSDKRKCLLLILVGERYHDCSVVGQLDAGGDKCLVHCSVHSLVIANGLTGRLHLRRKICIHAVKLGE